MSGGAFWSRKLSQSQDQGGKEMVQNRHGDLRRERQRLPEFLVEVIGCQLQRFRGLHLPVPAVERRRRRFGRPIYGGGVKEIWLKQDQGALGSAEVTPLMHLTRAHP